MNPIASTLDIGRSTVYDRLANETKNRDPYAQVGDAIVLPLIEQIAAKRPTYGYRRIAAVLSR